jgi:hypothetical protein
VWPLLLTPALETKLRVDFYNKGHEAAA